MYGRKSIAEGFIVQIVITDRICMYCLSDMYGLEEVCTQVNGLRISGIRVSAVYMTIHMYVSYEEKWVAWKRLPFDRGVIPYPERWSWHRFRSCDGASGTCRQSG